MPEIEPKFIYPPAYPPTATPGPWKAIKLHADGRLLVRSGWEITTRAYDVAAFSGNMPPFRKETDAVLAAAAPQLVAALYHLVNQVHMCLNGALNLIPSDLDEPIQALRTAGIQITLPQAKDGFEEIDSLALVEEDNLQHQMKEDSNG